MTLLDGARRLGLAALAVFLAVACADRAGDMQLPAASTGVAASSRLAALNNAPNLAVRTQPPAQHTAGLPTIHTEGRVVFNACASSDADAGPGGDTLNWQFHFGDSGRPAFDETGRFLPDVARSCHAEHTYERGTYTATVSVTDKHLEDQGDGFASLARATARFTIVAEGRHEDEAPARRCTAPTIVEGFESYATGTPATALMVPGVKFVEGEGVETNFILSPSPTNTRLLTGNSISFTLAEPRDSIRFSFAGIPGWALSLSAWCTSCASPGYKFGGRFLFPDDGYSQRGTFEHRGELFDSVYMTSGIVHIDDLELWCE